MRNYRLRVPDYKTKHQKCRNVGVIIRNPGRSDEASKKQRSGARLLRLATGISI